MLQVRKYNQNFKSRWNEFNKLARNGNFLFDRNYMDYHSDRFMDHSILLLDEKERIVACFPANEVEERIFSHQGLTYGGLIQKKDQKIEVTLTLWDCILKYYKNLGYNEIIYKHFPSFLNDGLIQDTDYAMFLLKATLFRRDTAFVIEYKHQQKIASNYIREAKHAKKEGFYTEFSDDLSEFWGVILEPNLKSKFGVKPVHDLKEIQLLKNKFSNEIKFFGVYNAEDELVGGTLLYDFNSVRHCQYISSTSEARSSGALNLLFIDLINHSKDSFEYFDFGIANENDGKILNKGLASWKQRMGGRAMCHDFYRINTNDNNLISE